MYVWQNKTRRDRRSRTHAEHEEVLDHDEELQEQLIDSIKVKAEEHKRNVLEVRGRGRRVAWRHPPPPPPPTTTTNDSQPTT